MGVSISFKLLLYDPLLSTFRFYFKKALGCKTPKPRCFPVITQIFSSIDNRFSNIEFSPKNIELIYERNHSVEYFLE
jgi:hypothetical protein